LLAIERTSSFDYWSDSSDTLIDHLQSSPAGLSAEEVRSRLARFGRNELGDTRTLSRSLALWNQIKSPVVLLLILAALASIASGELADATIVLLIVGVSVWLGFSRERRAHEAISNLKARIQTRVRVRRSGEERDIGSNEIVPGDLVLLSAGSLVPADCRILSATDFFVNEAVLTGESFPVEKIVGQVRAGASLAERKNCLFLGTNVRSGSALALVVDTGIRTHFGSIAARLALDSPETEFDRGIRHFGYLLAMTMFVMVILVSGANLLLNRPALETLLFAIALAVGLSPELLPAILTVNLTRGAQLMAERGVLVRHLNAIENLGSMDILCTDKTGTLTEGIVRLEGAYDGDANVSEEVRVLAGLNSALQTGLINPLDQAVLENHRPNLFGVQKLAEIPYDFVRKRLSVVVERSGKIQLITKGAVESVLSDCSRIQKGSALTEEQREALRERCHQWNKNGIRVLAVATRTFTNQRAFSREDEHDLTFSGFLTFLDKPKDGVRETLSKLRELGVSVKLITGDSKLVAQHVATLVGLNGERVLTGSELDQIQNEALPRVAEETDLFVEVDPNQKERIIHGLKARNHVLGFLGDGVNDAPAMHAADFGISVDGAADVAREAADFVLLDRNLEVIRAGIEEGRKTFANTLKYILTTTSANLGNMVSMAAASLFLPFLPLLASQILLNNFLSDIPAIGLADDSVDRELVERPRRWDMKLIRRFMLEFGLLSSVFDFLTFGLLYGLLRTPAEIFRTAWFVESLLTEIVIALIVRTRRPFYRSRPGGLLLWSSLLIAILGPFLPLFPFADLLGFQPLSPTLIFLIVCITLAYVAVTEFAKPRFFRDMESA